MKKIRTSLVWFLCFIIAFVIYTPNALAKAKSQTRYYYVTKVAYLYSSRSKSKKRLKKIDVNNTLSTKTPKSNQMYQVKYGGRIGYVYKSRLGTKAITLKRYTNRSSYIYSSNRADKKPMMKIAVDRKVITKSSQSAKMSKVIYGKTIGYIYNRNLSSKYVDYVSNYGSSQITRYDFSQIPKQQNSSQFRVPKFDASRIKNIPSAYNYATGSKSDMDVWDSWPLQNSDGTVAEYNGYHIVFAMAGRPNSGENYLYMFYQKVGDNSIDGWKNAGRVFSGVDLSNSSDSVLKNQTQEWSGTAYKIGNKIRLFYTSFSDKQSNGDNDFNQVLSTAQVDVDADLSSVKISGIEDHKSIFGGDGKTYQSIEQFRDEGLFNSGDNHGMRDPHYVEDNGHKYLIFQANTGSATGYQEYRSLYNKAYYGGDDAYFSSSKNSLLARTDKNHAILANAAIGIVELNDDYTLKKVMNPLLTANLVTEETERPNIVKIDGKWYLFAITKGYTERVDGFTADDNYMIGYVSDNLTGPYRPMNRTGLVLASTEGFNSRTYTYSYYAIPVSSGSNQLLITSYMTNRSISSTDHSTFAPSFLLSVNGDQTQVQPNSVLEQGQVMNGQNRSY
ncbi:glycoside hydrolase family 68 protein [Sporolactobacillus laevolacticus]|uniref:glycoside hydrolase family 68 protein n=1 Tax=Sporolactobacillus laevolacticus TaxID=33018 RepID=UPI0025B2B0A1|nr:glycoside hydrolase family 68 protein [Sporolactobacillus laevolacticus]MDN3954733.1 glycoside hydrolase family 68 protein [Sporolactobacillus laevolacticus]